MANIFPSIREENIALDFQTPISALTLRTVQFHAYGQKRFICHFLFMLSLLKLRNKLHDKSVFKTSRFPAL